MLSDLQPEIFSVALNRYQINSRLNACKRHALEIKSVKEARKTSFLLSSIPLKSEQILAMIKISVRTTYSRLVPAEWKLRPLFNNY